MDEETIRKRLLEIEKSLGHDVTRNIWTGKTEAQNFFKSLLKKTDENSATLTAETYVEMVDLRFLYYKVVWKYSEELLDDAMNGYSVAFLHNGFDLDSEPGQKLVEQLLTIDLERDFNINKLVTCGWFYFRNLVLEDKFKNVIEKSRKIWDILYESEDSKSQKVTELKNIGINIEKLVYESQNYLRSSNKYEDLLELCSAPYSKAARIFDELGLDWNGRTFQRLKLENFAGFTNFYLLNHAKIESKILDQLLEIDASYPDFRYDELILRSWPVLKKTENEEIQSTLLEKCPDRDYAEASRILKREFGGQAPTPTIAELKKNGYVGYADCFLHLVCNIFDTSQTIVDKNLVSESSEIQSFFKLVKIDEKLGTSFGRTISRQWNDLIKNEDFLKLLLTKSDSNFATATLIMFKFKENQVGWRGDEKSPDAGYTSAYLGLAADKRKCTSLAVLSEIETLLQIDLEEEASVPELVFHCCRFFPVRSAIQKIIETGLQSSGQEIAHFAREVFEFQDQYGINCLSVLFQLAIDYKNSNGNVWDYNLEMVREMENSFLYLGSPWWS